MTGEWWEHVPRWAKIASAVVPLVTMGITLIGALWMAAGDFERARADFRAMPAAIDSLRDAVFAGRLPERITKLETRTDSLSVIYDRVADLSVDIDRQGARLERVVCLVEVQLDLRANVLQCR